MTVIPKADADKARAKLNDMSLEEKRALAEDYNNVLEAIVREFNVKIIPAR